MCSFIDTWTFGAMSIPTQYPTSGGVYKVARQSLIFLLMTATRENTGRDFNFEEARGEIIS